MFRCRRRGAGFSLPGRDSSRPLCCGPAGAETSLGAARKSACATSQPSLYSARLSKWRAWLEAAVDHGLGLGQQSRFVCGFRRRTACSRSASSSKGKRESSARAKSLPFAHPVPRALPPPALVIWRGECRGVLLSASALGRLRRSVSLRLRSIPLDEPALPGAGAGHAVARNLAFAATGSGQPLSAAVHACARKLPSVPHV